MQQLSDPAIEAILKEWHTPLYDPPNTIIHEWVRTIGTLCDTYGIPDAQRAECAVKFIRSELRTELENVLRDARARFGSVHWAQFTNFMVAFDRECQCLIVTVEPFVNETRRQFLRDMEEWVHCYTLYIGSHSFSAE
jgi:hypothetical protein